MQNEDRVFETFLRQYRGIFRVLINAAEQITSQYAVSFEQYCCSNRFMSNVILH